MQNFSTHLQRQLGFIERSAQLFDEGNTEEAIRIATSLRVLFHKTRTQTPLVEHLGCPNVQLLDSAAPPEPITERTRWYDGLGEYLLPAAGVPIYRPRLEAGPNARYIPLPEWWNELVYVKAPDIRLTRAALILNAADKDGGAHVDATLPAGYIAVTEPGAAGQAVLVIGGENKLAVTFRDLHLVSLRQLAYEVLNSPDLTERASAGAG